MFTISAIIVLYNPNLFDLDINLNELIDQVDHLILIDNSEISNFEFIHKILSSKKDKLYYHFNNSNHGIATAQNIGINKSIEFQTDYILLMDQDSKPSNDMVSILLRDILVLKKSNINIAAIGPIAINSQNQLPYKPRLRRYRYFKNFPGLLNTNELISSGMFIDFKVLRHVGYLDENLFIDGVDHEWCWRAKRSGYFLGLTENTSLLHSLGEGDKFIFGIRVAISSPFRIYYQYRNFIYLFKKKHVPIYWKLINFIKYTIKYIYYPVFVSRKYFLRINSGIFDGFKL
jgi:rhamnosyltransferase